MAYYPGQFMPPQKKPLPAPDNDWVDHVQENRKYLKAIKKLNVCKDFEGLRDPMLFLLEVLTAPVEFKKEIKDKLHTKEGPKHLKSYVKFLDFLFLEVNEEQQYNDQQSIEPKESPSFSNLFQCIFTPEKYDVLVEGGSKTDVENETQDNKEDKGKFIEDTSELKEENKKVRDKSQNHKKSGRKKPKLKGKKAKGSKEKRGSKDFESKGRPGSSGTNTDKDIEAAEDVKSRKVSLDNKVKEGRKGRHLTNAACQGKAALIVMNGIEIIRSLQEHTINVKLTQISEDKGDNKRVSAAMDNGGAAGDNKATVPASGVQTDNKAEEDPLGTVAFRVPESMRMAVLSFVNTDTALPAKEKHESSYPLINGNEEEVGQINITVTLTCFGKAIENCIQETPEDDEGGFMFEHTKCWRTLSKEKAKIARIDPKLALYLMKNVGIMTPRRWESDDLLRCCLGWGLVEADEDEKRRVLRRNDCDWFRLVKQVRAQSGTVFDMPSKTSVKLLHPSESSKTLFDCGPKPIFSETTTWADATAIDERCVGILNDTLGSEETNSRWRKHRLIVKKFKESEPRKNSVFQRLEELQAAAESMGLYNDAKREVSSTSSTTSQNNNTAMAMLATNT